MVKPPPLSPLPYDESTPIASANLSAVGPVAAGPVGAGSVGAGPIDAGPIDGNATMVSPDDDTAPLPVILPDHTPDSVFQGSVFQRSVAPEPVVQDPVAPESRMRDPFEPESRMRDPFEPESRVRDPFEPESRVRDPFEPIERPPPLPRRAAQSDSASAEAPTPPEAPSAAKMDQIKDLYLTAEAIGEDALSEHFQQVSDRQRQLIKEYFDHIAASGTDGQTKAESP